MIVIGKARATDKQGNEIRKDGKAIGVEKIDLVAEKAH